MRFPRCPSPRWPEAQCDVTVIPGHQRGPRAPWPRATECAKGSQPVYTLALSDALFLVPRGLCNGRETSKTLTLCSPLDPTLFRPQLTRARTHRPSPNSPGEVENKPFCEPRGPRVQRARLLPCGPGGGKRQAGRRGRREYKRRAQRKVGESEKGGEKGAECISLSF